MCLKVPEKKSLGKKTKRYQGFQARDKRSFSVLATFFSTNCVSQDLGRNILKLVFYFCPTDLFQASDSVQNAHLLHLF